MANESTGHIRIQPAPFTCNILIKDVKHVQERIEDAFAASYRFKDVLVAPTCVEARFVRQELELSRLHNIMHYLWMAGRPVPPRPLHHQVLLRREIVISERMDMHLVWGRGCLFLKPIPRFLLIPEFWKTSVLSDPTGAGDRDDRNSGRHRSVRECALGFLVSYTALIAHESDFHIAQDKHLIPAEVTWQNWRLFIRQILRDSENIQCEVADRFIYGELRLNRLNLIYFFLGSCSTIYLPRWNSYASFFRENMQLVVAATVYIVVVLSALQVGLATTRLYENVAFQKISYGLTVFSLLGPAIAVVLIVFIFCAAFALNWRWAQRTQRERLMVLGRSWSNPKSVREDAGVKSRLGNPSV
ncbi:hypothetical protein BKA65DRAFT_417367 [Rhexocercosporidium sp. MPI-PUGE-AT-0058]|nr:hypothetical protein BKA65DRAFT_417367 [Rhexocercosporidium sp. MPI-PUGE-AT-0058]